VKLRDHAIVGESPRIKEVYLTIQKVAVTDATGSFDIKNLPPGTYTIEAWHEKFGTMQQKVTIGAKETKDAPFTFKAAATTATSD